MVFTQGTEKVYVLQLYRLTKDRGRIYEPYRPSPYLLLVDSATVAAVLRTSTFDFYKAYLSDPGFIFP